MHQDRDEMVRSFCVCLCGQAGICKFATQCPSCDTNVNYTEHILHDVLTHGLADIEYSLTYLETKPGYEPRGSTLICGGQRVWQTVSWSPPPDSGGQHSSQSISKCQKHCKPNNPNSDPCHYCGMHGHGRNSHARVKKLECPAYKKHCDYCQSLWESVSSQITTSEATAYPTQHGMQCSMPCAQSTILSHLPYNRRKQTAPSRMAPGLLLQVQYI